MRVDRVEGAGKQARQRAGKVALATFALQAPALLLVALGPQVALRDPATVLGLARGAAIAVLVAAVSARPAARAAASLYYTFILTAGLALLRAYHVPLDAQVGESALAAWGDVMPVLKRAAPTLGATFVVVLAVQWLLLGAAAPATRRARELLASPSRAALAAVVVAISFAFAPVSRSTAETRVFDLVRLARRDHPDRARGAVSLPPLTPTTHEPPSVLVILGESVRASDWCEGPGEPCPSSPRVHARTPTRIPFEMRAIASYTAVSFAALTTGRTQEVPKAELAKMPTVFDFVRAARGGGARLPSIYLSAQTRSVFEREEVPSLIDHFVTLEDLVGHPVEDEDLEVERGVDRLLAERCERVLPAVAPPYFAMVHFAGTHAPYFVDATIAPHQPWDRSPAWGKLDKLHNAYKNAILAQDVSVDRCLDAFLRAHAGRPWVVVYTSDHGEAFGERGAIHHGQGLYEEQIRVPAWVMHSEGAVPPAQAAALRARAARPATHLDVLPTILDALGLLGALGMEGQVARFAGRSLMATEPMPAWTPIPITNCTAMFRCPVSTWGMLGERRVLLAQPWDTRFRCADLRAPQGMVEPFDAECEGLLTASRRYYPDLPNKQPNR